jgi:uncharacterized protein with von Willebrand factor type A (vWA) domain
VQDWATESHRLAIMRAYMEPKGGWILGPDDIARNAPEVAEQLRKAGVRLAWSLQAALGQSLKEP